MILTILVGLLCFVFGITVSLFLGLSIKDPPEIREWKKLEPFTTKRKVQFFESKEPQEAFKNSETITDFIKKV